ncbi:hypothetical protein L210DRAFT_3763652 [Boletus edulis BED1]|uniref:FAD-binding PCMH-type domain-containing protein n=1 Tax=Boletus edulis BED1 TaxID=1328754 RepID=A0AAD4GAM0_BOLED|nr:hypothetical protein L210DRAFT_3763652 [Boletus edulis BED1]
MPSSSPHLSIFLPLCLVAGALAQIPQDPYAIPEFLATETREQASYTNSNYVTLGSPSWPSASSWETLNSTLGGRLQTLRPWAAVCYIEDPLYDRDKCKTVLSNYTNEHTRESIASALLWTNWESCGYDTGCALNYSDPQPVSGKHCHQGTTPPYGIAITSAEDASNVVKWAAAHNVKLTIKNTGVKYSSACHLSRVRLRLFLLLKVMTTSVVPPDLRPFRSSPTISAVSHILLISFPQGSSVAPVPALKIGSGTQLETIYPVVEAYNVSAVLGGCLTVGAAGGFIQAGGYSILSPAYGLAVDHLLEVEIVTADGVVRTINAVQDSDLFWAIRGGGAGSWGIILSITVATLPPTAVSAVSLTIAPNPLQDSRTLGIDFIALFGKYQNQIINSGIASTTVFVGGGYSLSFIWPVAKASISQLYPLFDELRALSSNYTIISNVTHDYPTLTAAIEQNVSPSADAVSFYGGSTELASRFVPRSMLEDAQSIRIVAEAIWEGLQIVTAPLQDHPGGVFEKQVGAILFGDMPAATKERVNETGANPGFYDAAWHVLYPGSWTLGTSESTYVSMVQSVHSAVGPLSALGMTASFQNEGSAWETNWQQAFFGYKYNQLQEIKQKYDPNNFFTTWKGVASTTDSAVFSCYHRT